MAILLAGPSAENKQILMNRKLFILALSFLITMTSSVRALIERLIAENKVMVSQKSWNIFRFILIFRCLQRATARTFAYPENEHIF